MNSRTLTIPSASIAPASRGRVGTLVALRLPQSEIDLLRMVFGGLESKMGLGSCQGAQEFALNQRSVRPCRHGSAPASKRSSRGRRAPRLAKTREAVGLLLGNPVSVDLAVRAGDATEFAAEGLEPVIDVSREACPACRSPRVCGECGVCRRCGATWQYLHVPSAQTSAVFDVNQVMPLEAWAWSSGEDSRGRRARRKEADWRDNIRRARDALSAMVEAGHVAHVVVLARMYSSSASRELAQTYPGLEDLAPIATMARVVEAHATKMTAALRRERRAARFEVEPAEALRDMLEAPSQETAGHKAARKSATDAVRSAALRLLVNASGAYLKARQHVVMNRTWRSERA
jgi:hypothetical protein